MATRARYITSGRHKAFSPVTQATSAPKRRRSVALGRSNRNRASLAQKGLLPFPATALLIAFYVPWIIEVGPVALTAYRLVLLVLIIPLFIKMLSGSLGKGRIADIMIVVFCLWSSASLSLAHGFGDSLETSGILFLETLGGYLVGRCCVRSASNFKAMASCLFILTVVILPFALVEFITTNNLALELFGFINTTFPDAGDDKRWGFTRVQAVFEHPILFGLSVACSLVLIVYVYCDGRNVIWKTASAGVIAFVTFLSLSSAPIAILGFQVLLSLWDKLLAKFQRRWIILIFVGILSYVCIDLASSRSPIEIYISYLTIEANTAWYRVAIWQFGTLSVWQHPWFGIGWNEYSRPDWMVVASVDNFWLLNAMRFGLPAAIILLLLLLFVSVSVVCNRGLPERVKRYRTAFIVVLVSYFLVGWTVHFWGGVYVMFLFIVGSGVWMLNNEPLSEAAPKDDQSLSTSKKVTRRSWAAGGVAHVRKAG
jgi:O-antigen ligase